MSSLTSFNSSESMSFLALSAVFLLVSPVLFMGFTTMWANIKQKVSDELYAHAIKIVNYLDIPEIKKIFTEFDNKLTAKVDTSISKFKSIFIVEINKIYAEIDGKLTAEAEKNKARDDDFTKKAQKIFSIINNIITKVNNIEEACRNEFGRINVVIKNLQNEINQHYAVVQRSDFDQQNVSEANSTNESETDSRGSSPNSSSSFFGSSSSSGKIKTK